MKKLCCRCHLTPRASSSGYCKSCWNAYQRSYYKAHRAEMRAAWSAWYRRNRKKVLKHYHAYYLQTHEYQLQRNRRYARTHRVEKLRKRNLVHAQVKAAVMAHYGPACKCCGETVKEFLTIDHINGGGTKHRKKVGGGSRFYAWLKRHHFPRGYRVLCYNCNQSLGFYGYCPHHPLTAR